MSSQKQGLMRTVRFRWTLNRYESSIFAGQDASHAWTRRLSTAQVKVDEESEKGQEDDKNEEDEVDEENGEGWGE